MKVLIVFYSNFNSTYFRKAFQDHLFSFKKYSSNDITYLNVFFRIDKKIIDKNYDVVIYHYSFFALKWANKNLLLNFPKLKTLKGVKYAIVQDEFFNSKEVENFVTKYGVEKIFTCISNEKDLKKIYPNIHSKIKFVTVLPGYINKANILNKPKPLKDRNLDVFYRTRNPPKSLGSVSLCKKIISDIFLKNFSEFNLDISYNDEDTIVGEKWLKKLGDSKFTLGAESGASILDYDGKFMAELNNSNTFDQKRLQNFESKNKINYLSVSPRVFEAMGTKTCIIQFKGDYSGILKPNVHYIPLNRDLSNINEVKSLMIDDKYCQRIVDNSFNEIIYNESFHYKYFVDLVFDEFKNINVLKKNISLYRKTHQFIHLKLLPTLIYIIRKYENLFFW